MAAVCSYGGSGLWLDADVRAAMEIFSSGVICIFIEGKKDDQLSGSQGTKIRTQVMAAVCSYGSGKLAGCAGNGDVQLQCYLFFYISILEDFSHADE